MYIVKDQSGRIWKTFKTNKEANDYVKKMSDIVTSTLSVEWVKS